MSWDAYLHDDRGHEEGHWNYTYNASRAANQALMDCGLEYERSWIYHLDGLSGAESVGLLDLLIKALESDPYKYSNLFPNDWGDLNGFLIVLKEMLKASLVEWPTIWSVT